MSELIKFNRGDIIFTQDSKEDFMYDVVSGRVGIYADWGKATETELAIVEHEFIGDMGLISRKKRIATAVAITDCELTKINADNLEEYLKQHTDKAIALVHQLYKRLSETDRELIESCRVIAEFLEAEEKVEEKPGLFEKMKRLAGIIK